MHPKWDMRAVAYLRLVVGLGTIALSTAFAQKPTADPNATLQSTAHEDISRALGEDDRLSLIAAALDARIRSSEPDCSHLVHRIYEQAGFTYSYAPSSELYRGVAEFQRIKTPQPGDLVLWRGHAGIVIKPSQHIFFSDLSTGPGIDDYTTPYWKHRGKPRFYRYMKSTTSPQRLPQLVRTNRVRHSTSDDTQ